MEFAGWSGEHENSLRLVSIHRRTANTCLYMTSGDKQHRCDRSESSDILPLLLAHVVHRPLGIEAEGRWLRQNALANTTESTYLVGPRMQFRKEPFSPYAKVLAGLGHFNFPYNDAHGSYFVIAPGAGVDFYVNNSLKIRLVDIEYQQWPQFTFGTISPYGVSFGLSYRVFNGSR
jgi:hypothetical protein